MKTQRIVWGKSWLWMAGKTKLSLFCPTAASSVSSSPSSSGGGSGASSSSPTSSPHLNRGIMSSPFTVLQGRPEHAFTHIHPQPPQVSMLLLPWQPLYQPITAHHQGGRFLHPKLLPCVVPVPVPVTGFADCCILTLLIIKFFAYCTFFWVPGSCHLPKPFLTQS